jgi:hypothetical protein
VLTLVRRFAPVVALLIASLLGAATPASARTGYWVVSGRWGNAGAHHDGLFASIFLQKTRLAPNNYSVVCVAVVNERQGDVAVRGCAERPFTSGLALNSAHASGTIPGDILRVPDGAAIGKATIRYDLTWQQMTALGPQVTPAAELCPKSPITPHDMTVSVAPRAYTSAAGQALGYVTVDGIGTVPFEANRPKWDSLSEFTGVAVAANRKALSPSALRCFVADQQLPG